MAKTHQVGSSEDLSRSEAAVDGSTQPYHDPMEQLKEYAQADSAEAADESGILLDDSSSLNLAESASQRSSSPQSSSSPQRSGSPQRSRRTSTGSCSSQHGSLEVIDKSGMRLEQSSSHLSEDLERAMKSVTFDDELNSALGERPRTEADSAGYLGVESPDRKIGAAAFSKDGPLPVIHKESSLAGPGSVITDFGTSIYDETPKLESSCVSSDVLSMADDKRSFQDQLLSVLETPHEEKKGFIPWNMLSSIVSEDRVRDELLDCLGDAIEEEVIQSYAKKICREEEIAPTSPLGSDEEKPKKRCFRKIFVILVLVGRTAAIAKFLDEDVNDAELPLIKVPRKNEKGAFDLRLSRNRDRVLKCFKQKWTQMNIRTFEEWQWTTLAPYFARGEHRDVLHYPLFNQAILPFTKDGRRDKMNMYHTLQLEGGFSRVFKVDIHPAHHNFYDGERKYQSFAVKRLHSPDQKAFKKEVEILKRFSNNRHPHLISLLVTYEQFNSYFLLFPWAEADLRGYWHEKKPKPKVDWDTTRWVVTQCRGIVDGVVNVHQYTSTNSKVKSPDDYSTDGRSVFGCHGDIKPENILWFPDAAGGTLKLSDFGLAELSTHQTRSKRPPTQFAASPSYRAPECDLDEAKLGRATDMWTLGCLFLEFTTWLLGGSALVEEFANQRQSIDPRWCFMPTDTFFKLVKCPSPNTEKAIVKPAVLKFIKQLHSHASCSQFIHDFLDIVQQDLLVVKSCPNDVNRITSEQLDQQLTRLLEGCKSSEEYACVPVIRAESASYYGGESYTRGVVSLGDTLAVPSVSGTGL